MDNPQVLAAAIGGGVSVIVAIIGVFSIIINAKLSASAKELELQSAKLDTIHEQTNSNLTSANARLDTALEKIQQLQDQISALSK